MPACPICESNHSRTFHAKEIMFNTNEQFEYQECLNCGCLNLNSEISDYSKIYPPNYYSFSLIDEKKINRKKNKFKFSLIRFLIRNRSDFWKTIFSSINVNLSYIKKLNLKTTDRILDIGCGPGIFPYLLKNCGFDRVIGLDPFIPKDFTYPKNNLQLLKKSIFEMDGIWDALFFNHSFEHIENPLQTLQKCNDLLSDNGLCVIAIPVSNSLAWKLFGTAWFQLDAPRHIYIHSTQSIKYLAQKCGFDLTDIIYNSRYLQFYKSFLVTKGYPLYTRPKLPFMKRFFYKFYKITYTLLSWYANKMSIGDQAVFVLKKNHPV